LASAWEETDMKREMELSSEIIAIGDMLIERYVEQKEALAAGDRAHAIALEFEIKGLVREKNKVRKSHV
jgi:hypothetical protein